MSDMKWLSDQLAQIARSQVQRKNAFNPNPQGAIHDGSTSDAVLEVLNRYAPRFVTFSQLVDFTGRDAKAVSWSIHHLKSLGRVEARQSGDPRSPLYLMYRVKQEAVNE